VTSIYRYWSQLNTQIPEFRIYALNPKDKAGASFRTVTSFSFPQGLPAEPQRVIGPIAIDARHNRLFAGEATFGKIYVKELSDHGRQNLLLDQNFGTIRGIAYDALRERLYVAAGHHVWAVTVGAAPQARDLSPGRQIQSASALAINSDGNIWVADEFARRMYLFSPSGDIIGTFPASPGQQRRVGSR
jgi:hypothetical protein